MLFSCNYFFLLTSSLFFFQVCAEAFNPDEEEEDTEQRVRVRESLHAWFSLQIDRQMYFAFSYHLCFSCWAWCGDIGKVTLLGNFEPLCLMDFFSHYSFNTVLLQRTREPCLSLTCLKFWLFCFLNSLQGLLRQFLDHRCCWEELVKLYHSCFFMGA